MKKVLALVMALVMMLACASACAESAYSYSEYNYDESLFAEITGDWYAIADFGLQIFVPDIFVPVEVTDEQASLGVIANFAIDDLSGYISMSYGSAVNVDGNPAEYAEELAAMFAANGAANVDIIMVNGWPMVTYMMGEQDFLGYSMFFDDATQLAISFAPASDANIAALAGLIITSVQASA